MPQILYKDSKIQIEVYHRDEDSHILRINHQSYLLQRGILNELSRTTGRHNIERKLNTVDDRILLQLEEDSVDPNDLYLALAQARITELEKYAEYLISGKIED